ncbi:unannotated protein [freshwater metagenome]|uniref:Unannotated protein n=1 Tax=freshwater metagenome TaxID=449393 RepID=A0A6J7Q7G9_9ZZZZ
MINSAGRTWPAYDVSGVIFDKNKSPNPAAINPGIIRGFGPNFGSNWDAIPAKTMMPAVNGKNAKPDLSGL